MKKTEYYLDFGPSMFRRVWEDESTGNWYYNFKGERWPVNKKNYALKHQDSIKPKETKTNECPCSPAPWLVKESLDNDGKR